MALILFAALPGLVIGSFLNVVIHRGPAVWKLVTPEPPRGSLWGPRSQCPHCQVPIKSWHNIPVISYFLLRGRCADCGGVIAIRYMVVELLGMLAALVCVIIFGWTLAALAGAVLLWALIALGFIDHETGYLPDALTLPLIGLGLIANGFALYVPLIPALFGTVAGYGCFWMIAFYYQRIRGREGLGLGDAKLLAALGAWCGWFALAPIILIASLAALGWVAFGALTGKTMASDTMVRFGPALAVAGAIIFIAQGWR